MVAVLQSVKGGKAYIDQDKCIKCLCNCPYEILKREPERLWNVLVESAE